MRAYCPQCKTTDVSAADRWCPRCGAPCLSGGGWPHDALLGAVVDGGKYRVEGLLGIGGFGRVYRVRHTLIRDRVLAMKVLLGTQTGSPEDEASFLNEVRLLMGFDHPFIVTCHEAGRLEDGSLFVLMEVVEGPTLLEAVEGAGGPLEVERVARLGVQIASALEAAHARGVLHRDLKPDNVMLAADGAVRVVDFGIAKILGPDTVGQELSRVIGTPLYMAPEQFERGESVDGRLDLYQLGAVLYFALTGRPPYTAEANSHLAAILDILGQLQRRTGQPGPSPSALRPDLLDTEPGRGLDALVAQLLSTERERRPASAREVQARLRAALGVERAPAAPSAGGWHAPSAEARRTRAGTVIEHHATTGGPPAGVAPARPVEASGAAPAALAAPPQAPLATLAEPAPAPPAQAPFDAARTRLEPSPDAGAGAASAPPRDAQQAAPRPGARNTAGLLALLALGAVGVLGAAFAVYMVGFRPSPAAQVERADDLYYGRGVPIDYFAALDLYERACARGEAAACVQAGKMHERGRGTPRDFKAAHAYYTDACDAKDPAGCYALGWLTYKGRGTPRDEDLAAARFDDACEGRYGRACMRLGLMHRDGWGDTAPNPERAVELFQRGCDDGSGAACYHTALAHERGQGTSEDPIKAVFFYTRACEAGSAAGCTGLGFMYSKGKGVQPDPAKAARFYQRACDGDDGLGCVNLGALYSEGKGGLKRDPREAAARYAQGCRLKTELGCTSLKRLCATDNTPPECK